MRMNAGRAEHIVMTFGDGEDAGKARERRADRQHRRDAHAPCPIEQRVDLASKLGMVKMAVTVYQRHRALALLARSTYLGNTADAGGSNVPGNTAWSAVIEANVRASFGMRSWSSICEADRGMNGCASSARRRNVSAATKSTVCIRAGSLLRKVQGACLAT